MKRGYQKPPTELNSLDQEPDTGTKEPEQQMRCKMSRKRKFLLIALIALLAIGFTVTLTLLLTREESTKVDSYVKTQYSLLIKTEITQKNGEKTSTTHDELEATLFGLDMKGERYTIMITNGTFTDDQNKKSDKKAPANIFMYFELNSKSSELLEAKYFKESFDEVTVNLLTGVVQAFVVDQDTHFDYTSDCKKQSKKSKTCSRNSKRKSAKKTVFQKKSSSDDDDSEDNSDYEHTSETWIDEKGKVEKTSINGFFHKKYKSEDSEEEINFKVKAEITVIMSKELDQEDIEILNDAVKELPEVELSDEYSKKDGNDYHEEVPEKGKNEHPDYVRDEPLGRQLSTDIEGEQGRRLFDNSFSYQFFSNLFDIPFYLNNRIYSGYDNTYKYWVCTVHRFKFGTIETSLTSTDLCLSSHRVSNSPKTALNSWSKTATVSAYLTTIRLSAFTINLNAVVNIKGVPYVETYYNTYGNTVTKLNTAASIGISITGQATIGYSTAGVTFTTSLTTNVNDYMVGYNSPFWAYMYIDKSHKGDYNFWVYYVTVTSGCYKIFGLTFCLPYVSGSWATTNFKLSYAYQYFPEQQVFYSPL
jgi:cytochrome oxidase Cu insertion factor (SCO1/SenC/PrrC family)